MSTQKQLDEFVRDLCTFLEEYTSYGVKGCSIKETDHYLLGKIEEQTGGDAIELWSEDNQITVVYSQSHWHCNVYNSFKPEEPRPVEHICREVAQDVLDIISGSLVTYSVWQGERALGGGSRNTVEEAIQSGKKTFSQATNIHVKQWCKELMVYEVASKSE